MTPSGSTAAEDIFLAARRMSPAEQQAYLDEACAGDRDLRSEVEEMLAAAAGSESFFADLAERLGVAEFFAEPAREASKPDGNPGMQVGPYRLTRLVGAGGMGTVWQAERSDGRFEGAVAVKLLNLSAGGPVARRFELEGRYLARLTHPSIARPLDAGVLDTGQPYLVLEYVEGAPIDRYCDDHELSIDERLRLFLDVLDGVAHAHSHLIVHRYGTVREFADDIRRYLRHEPVTAQPDTVAGRASAGPLRGLALSRAAVLLDEGRLAGGAADAARADLETAAIALANGYGDGHPETLRARALLRQP